MLNILKAAIAYFATVFAAGFLLGILRVTMVAPFLGEVMATLVELPVMLLASWFVCSWIIRRLAVPEDHRPRIIMGLLAFVLLIAAEMVLGFLGFGRNLSDQLQAYRSTGPLLGLLAQIAFAGFPWIQAVRTRA